MILLKEFSNKIDEERSSNIQKKVLCLLLIDEDQIQTNILLLLEYPMLMNE
jgi:hypothetical protein